ncbi:unnamed protein product [Clonostachys rosea]|uniref:Uncharacterized protein n=1 Tax=Bionectria ochroleuca TaxID=29856 RepID=A0ABY6UM09_BIOOC|nr:unnamed protein product [Clonostachys rosea]
MRRGTREVHLERFSAMKSKRSVADQPKETKSFPTNTNFANHFNNDNDISRDTIEVGLSPSDMELVDSDELSSVGTLHPQGSFV